ncbi:Mobile element protein [hydrothermal vent metagenome]|uniref:Mobile element protein n=1 Tax=hydrothermal vent metagenome TaxID=652676 RepID=A0A3B0YL50_9ZZZZ
MLKKNPRQDRQDDLFRPRLENIIDPRHELVKLALIIDWDGLESDLSRFYCSDNGRPAGSIRLMTGLCFLKDIKGLSDEEVCAAWCENPYFQHFCGETFFQHRFPVEPPSLSIFRGRIGEAGMERLLEETIKAGLQSGVISQRDLSHVTVDTTVQEKAVHFPTDVRLCHRARETLVTLAKEQDIPLRQSYSRKGKQAQFMANRYMAARQTKRARKKIKEVRNYLGRVMRNIRSAAERGQMLSPTLEEALGKAEIIYNQTLNPKSKTKLYSWHAPEVECIAKGKAHKKYEFGCKASYATTNKGNFIIGAMALHGKPYDGHTLKGVLSQITQLTGIKPREVQADLGYRGHGIKDDDMEIILARRKRGITPAIKKRMKRRNAIEPVIGHCKNDRKIGPRNWLKGRIGDKINAISMAIGFNMRKILRKIFLWLFEILLSLFSPQKYQGQNGLF